MKFKILTLETTELANIPKGVMLFRHEVFYIKELFMSVLPNIEINNSSKIELAFGPRGNDIIIDGILGSTVIFIEDFDFNKFYELNKDERETKILKVIVDSLSKLIIRKNGNASDIDVIEATAKKVKESRFNQKIYIKKLSKRTPDKMFKINIYRCINSQYGEVWICEIENKKNELVRNQFMTRNPDFLDRRNFFKVSQVSNDDYIVYNQFEKVVFKVSLKDL